MNQSASLLLSSCAAFLLVNATTRAQAQDEIVFEDRESGILALVFSIDGNSLFTGGWGKEGIVPAGVVKLWNIATWKERETLKLESLTFLSLAISPDGSKMATGGRLPGFAMRSDPGGVILWDLTAGKQMARFGENSAIYSVAFSPDGKTLAGGGHAVLKLWDVETRKERASFKVPEVPAIEKVAFSPDNKTLATGGYRRTKSNSRDEWVVQLWEVATGKELAVLKGYRG